MKSKALAYQRVQKEIKEDILSNKYQVGSLMPTEPELEKEYGVSRSTIRKAMELLAAEGYVDIKQGRGTMVKDFTTKQDFNRVTSVTESLRNRGYQVAVKKLFIEKIHPSEEVALKLQLSMTDYVAHFQRIQTADDFPISITENYIPYTIVPEIERETEIVSLYKYLEENYTFEIERTKDIISACSANFYEAEVLAVPIGTAILCIDRVCFNKADIPISYDVVKILGSRYQIEIEGMGRKKQ